MLTVRFVARVNNRLKYVRAVAVCLTKNSLSSNCNVPPRACGSAPLGRASNGWSVVTGPSGWRLGPRPPLLTTDLRQARHPRSWQPRFWRAPPILRS
eukprot:scaffold40272_cov68-Phaeocystis_antarctica.AAC.2